MVFIDGGEGWRGGSGWALLLSVKALRQCIILFGWNYTRVCVVDLIQLSRRIN